MKILLDLYTGLIAIGSSPYSRHSRRVLYCCEDLYDTPSDVYVVGLRGSFAAYVKTYATGRIERLSSLDLLESATKAECWELEFSSILPSDVYNVMINDGAYV